MTLWEFRLSAETASHRALKDGLHADDSFERDFVVRSPDKTAGDFRSLHQTPERDLRADDDDNFSRDLSKLVARSRGGIAWVRLSWLDWDFV